MRLSLASGLTFAQSSSQQNAKKIIIVIKSLGGEMFVRVIKMRYWWPLSKIAHHYKCLSILRREVVTKQTEGYSQQQQEEEEEILVFQVQSILFLPKNFKTVVKTHLHNHHNHGTQAGASLIAPGVVLTAAHKVAEFEWVLHLYIFIDIRSIFYIQRNLHFYIIEIRSLLIQIMTSISRGNPGDLVVRCGEWDTQTTGEPLDHQVCSSMKESWVLHAYCIKLRRKCGIHVESRTARWTTSWATLSSTLATSATRSLFSLLRTILSLPTILTPSACLPTRCCLGAVAQHQFGLVL